MSAVFSGESYYANTLKHIGSLAVKLRPTLKIFFSGMGRSEFFFLTSQIPYPLNLIVNNPNMGNKTKYINNAYQMYFI